MPNPHHDDEPAKVVKPKAPKPSVSETAIAMLADVQRGIADTGLVATCGKIRVSVQREVQDERLFGDDETRNAEITIELELERDGTCKRLSNG